jgi:hypothetical protein
METKSVLNQSCSSAIMKGKSGGTSKAPTTYTFATFLPVPTQIPMGTHCIIRFKYRGRIILCMFKHYDGYFAGTGTDLATFLKARALCNGIPGEPPPEPATVNLLASFACWLKPRISRPMLYRT